MNRTPNLPTTALTGLAAACAACLAACNHAQPPSVSRARNAAPSAGTASATERYYQLVLVYIKDAATFQRYGEAAGPIVARYGGGLERMLSPEQVHGEGLEKPDMVNLVYYRDRQAALDLDADQDFQRILPLRGQSIEMAAIGGLPIGGDVSEAELAKRVYLVELAQYGPQGAAGYEAYERRAGQVMQPYGYHVERRIAPESVQGLPFAPDVVKVAYFDTQQGMDAMHQDPAHPELENELYPGAVARSLWLVAKVHPATL